MRYTATSANSRTLWNNYTMGNYEIHRRTKRTRAQSPQRRSLLRTAAEGMRAGGYMEHRIMLRVRQ